MSLLNTLEADAEAALASIETFIDTTVWPDLKAFLTIFTPAEAQSLLSDILAAIPTATTEGVDAAAVQVTTQIGPQTVANAQAAAAAVVPGV